MYDGGCFVRTKLNSTAGNWGHNIPNPKPTHFERPIRYVQQMPLWRRLLLMSILVGLPLGVATLEGVRTELITRASWRSAFFPTVILIYIMAVAPWIWRAEQAVVEDLRPLIPDEGDPNDALTYKRWWRSSQGDWVASGFGILCGGALFFSSPIPDLHLWSMRYWLVTVLVMYAALAWLIYAALGSARLTAILHRHVQHKDPFDLTPFEPVGRQGLILAIIFVGAITLSLFFIDTRTIFLEWQGILVYSILVLVTVSIFFTVMWPAHRVLQRVKQEKLANVQRMIGQAFGRLETPTADGADTQRMATEMQAWLMLEQRLKQTRTWPYDTEILRTLFLSVLTPLFVAIARVVGTYLTEGHF